MPSTGLPELSGCLLALVVTVVFWAAVITGIVLVMEVWR